ncbi:MAG: tetratricopeptide repeat protein [Kiritimatiellae bacterium]|nr:tetratricopeptide repeat protein [Kiritimatiellia bacterium]MDW8458527.1 tetratricopeptide repeat protein [Verrucomicrobiota bacterium]
MDEYRDFYAKPPAKPNEPPATLPAPEILPGEARAITRRRIVYSIALMVLLLAAASLLFLPGEKDGEGEDTDVDPTDLDFRPPRPQLASIPAAPATDSGFQLDRPPTNAPPDLPPQRMAEIMGLLREANRLMVNKEWDAAEARIRSALAQWPEMNTALRMLGALYLQRGQFDQAILILERAMRADPFNVDAFVNLAIAHMQKGELDRAEDLLLSAIELRPEISVTHINLGLLYILRGEYDQAAEHLAIAVERMPDNPSARNNLGVALFRLGRVEEARRHFLHLIARNPERAEPYFSVASTHVVDGNYAEAFEMIRRGILRCSPVEARRYLMDHDFDTIRDLPEFQAIWRELSEPRPIEMGAAQ